MLLQMAGSPFLRLNNILLYIYIYIYIYIYTYTPYFLYSSVDRHLGCLHVLAVMNTVNKGVQVYL